MRKEPRMEAWSDPIWQDKEDESTKETEKEVGGKLEYGVAEAT